MKRDLQTPAAASAQPSRREFLRLSGKLAAGTALAGLAVPHVHAAEDNTIRLALIGCGGRGNGAVGDALRVPNSGPVKLWAMADIFSSRLESSKGALTKVFADRIDVSPERQFVGFDSYKQAIDCLRPGDVAMLTGYAAFRPMQLEYAVSKGINVFMEKSFAADPPGVRRVIKASEEADKKNVKIAAGLMCRHSPARIELIKRLREGELGDLQLVRVYRMEPVGPMGPKRPDEKELHYQVRNFFRFLWVAGGLYAEMTIHQIDEICWIKDQMPVTAHGLGGRSAANLDPAQNLDTYSIEYTFADGTKATVGVRYLPNCHNEFATYIHGTKKAAQFSGSIHASTVHTYKDQRTAKDNIDWQAAKEPYTIWQMEWNDLIDAIRNDRPYNEGRRAAMTNLADIMGRASVHMGRIVTWDEAMESNFQWVADIDNMNDDTPAPVAIGPNGMYPSPTPGAWTEI